MNLTRYHLPLLIEPAGQRVQVVAGAHLGRVGFLTAFSDMAGRSAYLVKDEQGHLFRVYATELDLDVSVIN